jgi:hypothetical protein
LLKARGFQLIALENQLEYARDSQQTDDENGDYDPHQDFHVLLLSKLYRSIASLLKRQRFS